MEWSFLGAVGAFGAMFLALIALFQLQLNRLETRLRDEMRRNHQLVVRCRLRNQGPAAWAFP